MKNIIYPILACAVIGAFMFSCEQDKETSQESVFKNEYTNDPTCKTSFANEQKSISTASNLSCVEYTYDAENQKLYLLHVNAGFNCCPEELYYTVKFASDTILIQEYETDSDCDCNCLYDLNMEVEGVENTTYQIKFIESYASDMAELLFEADLSTDSTGSYCVTREHDPWGSWN